MKNKTHEERNKGQKIELKNRVKKNRVKKQS